jgi:DNA-binding transcriptional MerR regulator
MPKFKIGALAAAAGVKPDTIRYYERLGLLNAPGRTRSGYRMYDGDVLDRLLFIRSIQELGFTLEQARTLLGATVKHRQVLLSFSELLGQNSEQREVNWATCARLNRHSHAWRSCHQLHDRRLFGRAYGQRIPCRAPRIDTSSRPIVS